MSRFVLSILFFILGMHAVYAQDLQISGRVTSADDSTILAGVTIIARGTAIDAVSDHTGRFDLTVPPRVKSLVFSYPGMIIKEVTLAGKTMLHVMLEPDILGTNEELATALGISREVRSLGYSIQELGPEELSMANTADLINTLNGKMAGVRITSTSGMPGSSVEMTLRGPASLLGDNQPMFVIDGMPVMTGPGPSAFRNRNYYDNYSARSSNRSIDLNPEDIAGLTVLQGGAAAAL